MFLFDSYYARRLGRRTTGSAARASDSIGIGTGNLILQPGESDPADILSDVKDGLYLTGMMGFGVNPTTGDISKGAYGIWIENGQLTYPVSEITIAGNLLQMFQDIEVVGNDLVLRHSIVAPTIKIAKLTVAGS